MKKTLISLQMQLVQLDGRMDEIGVRGSTGESTLKPRKDVMRKRCEMLQTELMTKLEAVQATTAATGSSPSKRPSARRGPSVQVMTPTKSTRNLDLNLDRVSDALESLEERKTAVMELVLDAVADHEQGYARRSTSASLQAVLRRLLVDLDVAAAELEQRGSPSGGGRSVQGDRHEKLADRDAKLKAGLQEGLDQLTDLMRQPAVASLALAGPGRSTPRVSASPAQWNHATVNAVLSSGSTGGVGGGTAPPSVAATDTPALAWRDDDDDLSRGSSAQRRLAGLFGVNPADFDPRFDYDFTPISEREDSKQTYHRGGQRYYRPCGWKRLALDVKEKYWPQDCSIAELKQVLAAAEIRQQFSEKSEMVQVIQEQGLGGNVQSLVNCRLGDWLGEKGHPGEWCNAYHGTSPEVAKHIADQGLRRGGADGVAAENGARFGPGVYCTPQVKVRHLLSSLSCSLSCSLSFLSCSLTFSNIPLVWAQQEAELYAQGAEVIADVDGTPTTKYYEVIFQCRVKGEPRASHAEAVSEGGFLNVGMSREAGWDSWSKDYWVVVSNPHPSSPHPLLLIILIILTSSSLIVIILTILT